MSFRIKHSFARAAVLLLGLLFTASIAVAQVTTGSLQGVVLDSNKAAVAGAAVKVTNVDTGQIRETTTNSEGFYRVTNLQPGRNYKIEVSAQGFAPQAIDSVAIQLATENTQDIDLAAGSVTGNVEVSATDQQLIQSTQNQLSTSYSPQQLTQLPYNGGLIDNLALLTPGVSGTSDATFTNGVGISANGNRGRSNNFQIDGQDNNDNSVAGPSLFLTNTDAIGEFQVITNNFSAEFGRNSGAQINVITKPGTNQIHGTAFEFLQNSKTNASTNLDKRATAGFNFLAKNGSPEFAGLAARRNDPYTYNRFGGSVGGPLKKNKAFFFVTYQADRQTGETQNNDLGTGAVIFTPQSSVIAGALGFPGAQKILLNTIVGGGPFFAQGVGTLLAAPPVLDNNGDGVPDAFAVPGGNHFFNSLFVKDAAGNLIPLQSGESVRITRNVYQEDQLITREDFNLTSKDVLSLRYIYDNTRFPLATGRFTAGAIFDVPSQNNNLGTTYTRTISSRMINEARFNFSRLFVTFGDVDSKPGPGIGFSGQRDLAGNFFSLTFGTQNNLPQSRKVDVYQEQDTISATLGNHALKFGGDLRQQRVNNFFLPNFLGTYTFRQGSGGGTVPAAGVVCPLCTFYTSSGASRAGAGALAFENLLLARPWRINFALGNPREITAQDDYFFFVQDDWRVAPSLTLNLGLRYEVSTSPFNPLIDQLNAREGNASTAIFDPAYPIANRTTGNLPLDKNNFAPRLGFAWTPNFHFLGDRFTNGRTVIRGGFGIAYDPSFFNIVLNTVTAAPFAAAGLVQQTSGGVGSVNFPFSPTTVAQLNTTPTTNAGDPRLFNQTRVSNDFHNPYTLSFNFGIQQEIFKNTVLEVRYVGSRIKDQFQTVNGNPDLRFLAQAGQAAKGNPGLFTHGILPGTCSGPTCITPTAANGFQSRTNDPLPAGNTNRITGSGRVDPNFGITRTRTNGANSEYNGLQVRFDTRFRNDLTLGANYTFSKTMDNASEIFSTFGEGQTVAQSQDPFDTTTGERGLSAFHQKHTFTANFIYNVPFFKGQNGAAGHLLGGWQVSGIISMGSGRPYTPTNFLATYDPGFENTFVGAGALRPFNGNPTAPVGTIAIGVTTACAILFFDPACNNANAFPGNFIIYNTNNRGSIGQVVTPAQALQQARLIYNDFGSFSQFGVPLLDDGSGDLFTEAFNMFRTPYGNVGRNTFFGTANYNTSLALSKTTNFTERTKLEFRVEASNVFNHRNFGVPDPFTEDAFGVASVATFQNPGSNNGGSRTMRFGLKVIF